MIPYGRQSISEEDIQSVVEVLKSDFLTQGHLVPEFESKICHYTGAKYGVAVNSGTSALHIACLALGLTTGDILWTSPITFVASANCGLYCGASVDFVDIDPKTFNISISALENKLEIAEKQGKLPKVLVPVHLCGLSCDMEIISQLSKRYGFRVIEDGCHAIGGRLNEDAIGSCKFSDITVFSFHPVKIITTAEGGMAVTNDKELADAMALHRSHGITRNQEEMTQEPDGPWFYQQTHLGFNYRMTDIQAALGVSQMNRLDSFVQRRHEIANSYDELFVDLPVTPQYRPENNYSGMHLYIVRLQLDKLKNTHREVFEQLRKAGVGVNIHYIPVHTQPWYQNMGFKKGDFPEAEKYYAEAITLPMYPELNDEQIKYVNETLQSVLVAG